MIDDEPDHARALFKMLEFIPLKIEIRYYDDTVEYTGISPMFDVVRKGYLAPNYDWVVTKSKLDEWNGLEVSK